jgi:hypothetical protein
VAVQLDIALKMMAQEAELIGAMQLVTMEWVEILNIIVFRLELVEY